MYSFTEGSFAVRNGWYVAAFAHEVGHELLSRTILNKPVVLYRKEDGEAVAVGGQCPHRHFPLGSGCLKGDAVVCGYHGIAFGPDGQCVSIPSQTHVPRTYKIPSYPLAEHGIWLWIWMGDAEKADKSLLPDLEEIGAVGEGVFVEPFFVEFVDGRYQLLNDNLLDLSHLAYLHGTSIGTVDDATVPEILTKRPRHLSCRREKKDITPPAVTQASGLVVDKIDRVSGMDFYLPGFHAGIDESRWTMDHPTKPGEVFASSRIYHAVTPATTTTCNYFFAMSSRDKAGLDFMRDYLRPIIEEDKFATEEIEKMLKIVGEAPDELLIKTDRNAVEGRRMLQAMMDAEREDAAANEGHETKDHDLVNS